MLVFHFGRPRRAGHVQNVGVVRADVLDRRRHAGRHLHGKEIMSVAALERLIRAVDQFQDEADFALEAGEKAGADKMQVRTLNCTRRDNREIHLLRLLARREEFFRYIIDRYKKPIWLSFMAFGGDFGM